MIQIIVKMVRYFLIQNTLKEMSISCEVEKNVNVTSKFSIIVLPTFFLIEMQLLFFLEA